MPPVLLVVALLPATSARASEGQVPRPRTPASVAESPAYEASIPQRAAVACPSQLSASAYVCCDGGGALAVCVAGPSAGPVVDACILHHERTHLRWFAEHRPAACAGRPAGSCAFELAVSDFQELECSGYRAEVECLDLRRPLAAQEELRSLLKRRWQLRNIAKRRFDCRTSDW